MIISDILAEQSLVERTLDNMQVLGDVVEVIVRNLPFKFGTNTDGFDGHNMAGYNGLLERYRGSAYAEFIKLIGRIGFLFKNTEESARSGTLGTFIAKPNLLVVFNISGFVGRSAPIERDALLSIQRNDIPIKTFRAIILHELRHVYQSASYEKYYYGRGNDDAQSNYKSSPIEVDAAWVHHLQDFPPIQYPNGVSYADAVMGSFLSYKSLSPQWQEHYRRKTIRYWMETNRQTVGADRLAGTSGTRMVSNRTETRTWLVPLIQKIAGQIDLRRLPGYSPEAVRFFLPSNAITATASLIEQQKPITALNAPIVFLVLSLVVPVARAAEVIRLMRGVHKITPSGAIAGTDGTFGQGWDTDAVKRQIASVFGS